MNLQENIRRIQDMSGDYHKLPTWFKRRVSEELLEDTFKLSLLEAKRAFYNSASTLDYSNFEYHTIYYIISKFYKRLPDNIMEEYQTL